MAERVRRLEDAGVIRGYRAAVGFEKLSHPFLAPVRIRPTDGDDRPVDRAMSERPEIVECHPVTGEDCFVVNVATRSLRDLERAVGFLGRLGSTATPLVFSTLVQRRVRCAPGGDWCGCA